MWKNKSERPEAKKTDQPSGPKTSVLETLKQPIVWLSILLFFLYCGAEGTMGYWTYSILTESRGIDPKSAGLWAGSYWAMFTIGRIAAGLYTRRVGNSNLVRFSLFAALIGATLLWWNPFGTASLPAVAITGLAIAPIFPALVSGTHHRVSPRHTANAIGMQMGSGGLGLALIPALLGVLARRLSLEVIPICLLVLFVLLLGLHTLSLHLEKDPERQAEFP
jgi:fucose permease